MNYLRFLDDLSGHFVDWGLPTVRPKSDRFHGALAKIFGMTTVNVMQLLNLAVACLEEDERYGEVGTFLGATLVGALLDHPTVQALAVDNFSEFTHIGADETRLRANLTAFGLSEQVEFHGGDFESLLPSLRTNSPRLGVYFYDGAHDYRSQLLGLLLAVPLLSERAVLVIDDTNMPSAKQATWDFLSVQPAAHLLIDLPTPGNCHASFWNGLMVVAWDAKKAHHLDEEAKRRARQEPFLESLRLLQQVRLHRSGNQIGVTVIQ